MEAPSDQPLRPRLADSIAELGKQAFDPARDASQREAAAAEFEDLIEKSGTWPLVRALNSLIKPEAVPPWLRPRLVEILTLLPLRRDGVRASLEFVFAVHPSSAPDKPQETTETSKRGASITRDALETATQLLCAPARSVTLEEWIKGMAPQILSMLDGKEGTELVRVASHVICSGFLARRQFGIPGAPAWVAFVGPILRVLDPSIGGGDDPVGIGPAPDDVVDLSGDAALASPEDLVLALRRLMSLVLFSPYPSQCRRMVGPVLLPLWTLASWPGPPHLADDNVCEPARALLHTFLKIASSNERLLLITHNLLGNGKPATDGRPPWKFALTADDKIRPVRPRRVTPPPEYELGGIPQKSEALADLIGAACSGNDISSFFLALFETWLKSGSGSRGSGIEPRITADDPAPEASLKALLEITVLQKMMERIPEKLISRFDQLLGLICQVLDADREQPRPEDIMAVTLSLLNLVITSPEFQKSQLEAGVLEHIETSLERLGRENRDHIAPTARNLRMLLENWDDTTGVDEPRVPLPSDRQIEDRRTYALAMSYIAEKESPPPVKSEGLNLISGLVLAGSNALDIPAVLVLLSALIRDDEDFLNLRIIKVYAQLAGRHPNSVVEELLDRYVDPRETSSTDVRLRYGEALLQVIQRLGETFTGEVARRAGEALLSVAGRRGFRPKTQARQEREARLQEARRKEAEDAWGGEAPDLSDELSGADQARNELYSQIVAGWESKRGGEDVRIRSSALSIFAAALEANVACAGPTLASTCVDLCINVLVLETEIEKAILRRSAIMLVLGFVRGLDGARREGRRLGFGLTEPSREDVLRTLRYVAATDNDGLVRGHADDVVESLENWNLARFLPPEQDAPLLLSRLAGLGSTGPANGPRPVIEEVED